MAAAFGGSKALGLGNHAGYTPTHRVLGDWDRDVYSGLCLCPAQRPAVGRI